MNIVLNRDMTTRVARPFTQIRSASTSSNKPSSSVKKSKSKPQPRTDDYEVDINGSTECLPEGKFTAPSGNIRHPPERWLPWEVDFMEKCFETTQWPSPSLKSKWASTLTEKRLRHITLSSENNENLAKVWLSHYKRRISNWFKNRKAKLRREGKPLTEEDPEDLESDEECSVTSHVIRKSKNHVTVTKGYTSRRNRSCQEDSDSHEEEFRDDSPESEEGQSVSGESENDHAQTDPLDEETSHSESRLSVSTSFQQLMWAPRNELLRLMFSGGEDQDRLPLTFPVSGCRDEPYIKHDDGIS